MTDAAWELSSVRFVDDVELERAVSDPAVRFDGRPAFP